MSSPDNTTFFFFDSNKILSIFVMIIGKLYTHYMFVHIWTNTISFLFGPRWLVPNSFVYRLLVGSA